jgi:hypothetical protein
VSDQTEAPICSGSRKGTWKPCDKGRRRGPSFSNLGSAISISYPGPGNNSGQTATHVKDKEDQKFEFEGNDKYAVAEVEETSVKKYCKVFCVTALGKAKFIEQNPIVSEINKQPRSNFGVIGKENFNFDCSLN